MDFFGVLGIILCLTVYVLVKYNKKQNKTTQQMEIELQSLLDEMNARDFYIHKVSQASLIWDPRTQAYIRKWNKNDTTYH